MTTPAFDMSRPEFWESAAVETELRRVYDICNSCRRCLPLCPSFKVMFDRLDVEAVDGDAKKLPAADVKEVVDLCYQCKLCFNHCPYTPPHRWAVDFPRLMLRATCSVAYNAPAIGRAAVAVLERNGVDVTLPAQGCCGMPYLDGGAVDECRRLVRDNVRALAAAVREGREIVSPGPTCSYMLKQEYPWLDGSDDARLVATHTRDLFEYLAQLHADGALDTSFSQPVGAVTYHVPCHLRAQNIGTRSADVLRTIPGAKVDVVERCSAVDGTWGFKTQYFELSMKIAQPLFDAVRTAGAPMVATDCPLAALQIAQGTGVEPRHPIQVLAQAYGLEDV